MTRVSIGPPASLMASMAICVGSRASGASALRRCIVVVARVIVAVVVHGCTVDLCVDTPQEYNKLPKFRGLRVLLQERREPAPEGRRLSYRVVLEGPPSGEGYGPV
jgi:hypothetical protein